MRRGLADNYWHGRARPGGPMQRDLLRPRPGRAGLRAGGSRRGPLPEFWNLVFMQESLSTVRAKVDFDIEAPLPKKNIDTGMGLGGWPACSRASTTSTRSTRSKPVLVRGGR